MDNTMETRTVQEASGQPQVEILRGENRETCAGFYNGRAAEDSLIYHPNSDANVNHDFLATVKSFDRNTGTAVIETRNPIDTGMEIEVLSPGMNNRVFTLSRMKNEDGEFMEQSRRPMALLKVPVPFEVREEDILRRNR